MVSSSMIIIIISLFFLQTTNSRKRSLCRAPRVVAYERVNSTVSMQSFEHFDALFTIDKSIERGKLLMIFPSLFMSMLVEDSRKIALARKRKTNCAIILSRHFHGLHQTNQNARNRSVAVTVKKQLSTHRLNNTISLVFNAAALVLSPLTVHSFFLIS